MFRIKIYSVYSCNELGNIASGLPGQIIVYLPVILFVSRSPNGLINITRAAVIGSNYQHPVIIDTIKITHIPGSGMSRFQRIAPVVNY